MERQRNPRPVKRLVGPAYPVEELSGPLLHRDIERWSFVGNREIQNLNRGGRANVLRVVYFPGRQIKRLPWLESYWRLSFKLPDHGDFDDISEFRAMVRLLPPYVAGAKRR